MFGLQDWLGVRGGVECAGVLRDIDEGMAADVGPGSPALFDRDGHACAQDSIQVKLNSLHIRTP